MALTEKKLPLNMRVQIRDFWESPTSPLRSALVSLERVLGVDIVVECNWIVLLEEMKSLLRVEADLVPAAAQLVEEWARYLEYKLGSDEGAQWIDHFIDAISQNRRLRAVVEQWQDVSQMEYEEKNCTFKLRFSNSVSASRPWADLKSEFEALLLGSDHPRSTLQQQQNRSHKSSEQDKELQGASFPNPRLLPSPETLFKSMAPYYLTVRQAEDSVEIESSHEQSLELIQGYFSKYIRSNSNYAGPIFEFQLIEANFGRGPLYDRLRLTLTNTTGRAYPRFNTIPTLQLVAFVEGVLGYTPLSNASLGIGHHFKRSLPFV